MRFYIPFKSNRVYLLSTKQTADISCEAWLSSIVSTTKDEIACKHL